MNAEQIAENYINGNITETKKQLRDCHKITLLETAEIIGIKKTIELLRA